MLCAADASHQMMLSTSSDEFFIATQPDGSFLLCSTIAPRHAVSSRTLSSYTTNQFILAVKSSGSPEIKRHFSVLCLDSNLLLDPKGFRSFLENRCFVASGPLPPQHYLGQEPPQDLPTHLMPQDLPPENLQVIGHLGLVYNGWTQVLKAIKAVATGRVVREKLKRESISGGWESVHSVLNSYCRGWKSRSTPNVRLQNRLVYTPKPTIAAQTQSTKGRSYRQDAPAAVVQPSSAQPRPAFPKESPSDAKLAPWPPSNAASLPRKSNDGQPALGESNGDRLALPPISTAPCPASPAESSTTDYQPPPPPIHTAPLVPHQSVQGNISPPRTPTAASPIILRLTTTATSRPALVAPSLASRTNLPEVPTQIPRPMAIPPVIPSLYEGPGSIVQISLEELTHVLCSARQKGTGKMHFNQFRIESEVPNTGSAVVFFCERLITGLRVQGKQIEPPQGNKVMCIFGCRPTCHLSNVKDAREHQRPRLSKDGAGRCQSFSHALKCPNRHEFRRRKSLHDNPIVVQYREDKEGHWLTQLHSLGRSLLVFAYHDLKLRDQNMADLWIYHHNKE